MSSDDGQLMPHVCETAVAVSTAGGSSIVQAHALFLPKSVASERALLSASASLYSVKHSACFLPEVKKSICLYVMY